MRYVQMFFLATTLAVAAFAQNPISADSPYQVHYFANLTGAIAGAAAASVINFTNTGANGAGIGSGTTASVTGSICANIYVFDQDEEMVECCSCAVTPDGLDSVTLAGLTANKLFVDNNIGNVVVKILATAPVAGSCSGSDLLAGNPPGVNGLLAWGTNVHAGIGAGVPALTETAFIPSTLSGYSLTAPTAEYARLQYSCGITSNQGTGGGVCPGCSTGGLGGARAH